MPLFKDSFDTHIIEELNYRKSFNALQTALVPHVKVTSLVETEGSWEISGGNQTYQRLKGFTLGITDVNNINSLSSYFNNSGHSGTAVGLTYTGTGASPEIVSIKTKDSNGTAIKNLPPPGVTNVSISTQSKGGFIFKAVINLKFYGKDQYDFIYQTMLRPGNPIVIEYGHTRSPITNERFNRPLPGGQMGIQHSVPAAGTTNKDLEFFKTLDENTFQKYVDNFKNNIPLSVTRNSGTVIGLVSNFSTKLNSQNEYEAQIEIINALEFLFSLGTDDTFLDYRADSKQARSVRQNFGLASEEGWEPEHDQYFLEVIKDGLKTFSKEGPTVAHRLRRGGQSAGPSGVDYTKDFNSQIILPSEWTSKPPVLPGDRYLSHDQQTSWRDGDLFRSGKADSQQKYIINHGSDIMFLSLTYFFDSLLPKIIETSFSNEDVFKYDVNIQSGDDDDPGRTVYYPELRSVDIKKIIINNDKLYGHVHAGSLGNPEHGMGKTGATVYSEHFREIRQNSYSYKYKDSSKEAYFSIVPEWEAKEQYTNTNSLGGIFINYMVVRDAFNSSNSVGEAIQRVLNQVNTSSSNILNLKMRYIDTVTSPEGFPVPTKRIILTIYDENKMVDDHMEDKQQGLFSFFSGDVSEALSYDLDFSLPTAIASSVMASTYEPLEVIGGSNSKSKRFVDYGYALDVNGTPAVKSMFPRTEGGQKNAYTADELDPTLEETGKDEEIRKEFERLSRSESKRSEIRRQIFQLEIGPPSRAARGDATMQVIYQNSGYGNVTVDLSKDENKVFLDRAINVYLLGVARENIESGTGDSRSELGMREEERIHQQILGYRELAPASMKSQIDKRGIISGTSLPAETQINIKLQGLDGFKFGNLFTVKNVLPSPYNESNVFMVTGYRHTIDSSAWTTELQGQLIASKQPHFKKSVDITISDPVPIGS